MRSSLSERLLPAETSPRQARFTELCRASLRYMVQEAATGIVAADVWVMDHASETAESPPMLRRMSSACYIDPGFDCPTDSTDAFDKLFAVTDSNKDAQCAPGVSLAGVLFAAAVAGSQISWQRLEDMANNPEFPSDSRTTHAASCFGFVAGAAFESQGSRGVICLFARETADLEKLQSGASVAFLNACAAIVGSLVVARRASVVLQATHDASSGAKRFKLLRMLSRAAGSFRLAGSPQKAVDGRCRGLSFLPSLEMLRVWVQKARGTNTPPLASASWGQAAFAFLGAVATGLVVVSVNETVLEWTHDPLNTIVVASLGALMTMHYAAFNSPLAQPRNVFGGNLIAALTAIFYEQAAELVHRTSGVVIEQWCLFVLAPATTIAVMHKLGLTHPPAGAIAITLVTTPSSATWRWVMTPLLAGNVICTIVAIMVNNLSSRRQYPLYW